MNSLSIKFETQWCPEELERDYEKGLLHLAWLWDNGVRRLIFAQFELFPREFHELEESVGDAAIRPRLVGKLDPREQCINLPDKRRLYYIRAAHSAKCLMYLYQNLVESGKLQLFWMDSEAVCVAKNLKFEPTWPNLDLSRQENRNDPLWSWPYLSQGWGDVRCQHAIALPGDNWLDEILTREKPALWLKQRLGWDIDQYPELWGSAHLTLPNPIYKKIDCRVVPPDAAGDVWKIHFAFQRRTVVADGRIELDLLQRGRAGMRKWPQRVLDLKDYQELFLELPEEPEQIAFLVSSPGRGLLSFSSFSGFLKNITVDLAISQKGIVRIRTLDDDGKEVSRIDVPRDGLETVSVFQEGDIPEMDDWGKKVSLARKKRSKGRECNYNTEEWFDDEETARGRIAEILRSAKDVRIVDPYFCKEDLIDYVVASCRIGANIDILTSMRAFGDDKKERDCNIRSIQELVKALCDHGRWNITIKAMSKNAAIHDRFLILDNSTVWYSGASLNHIGSRGCIIDRLNNPSFVIDKIDSVIANEERVKNIWPLQASKRPDSETSESE